MHDSEEPRDLLGALLESLDRASMIGRKNAVESVNATQDDRQETLSDGTSLVDVSPVGMPVAARAGGTLDWKVGVIVRVIWNDIGLAEISVEHKHPDSCRAYVRTYPAAFVRKARS